MSVFSGIYNDWNRIRTKAILDFYGQKFFYRKRVADLGAGHGDIGGTLHRFGSDITAVDCRPEHLHIIKKKFSQIETVRADLDHIWPLGNKKYDLILDLDVMCHLLDYKKHLQEVCAHTDHLVLETYVVNSSDESKSVQISEGRGVYDFAYNGGSKIPTAAEIESTLTKNGFSWKRMDDASLNIGNYKYNWELTETDEASKNNRRLWFAHRNDSSIQFKSPDIKIISAPISPKPIFNNFYSPPADNHIFASSIGQVDSDIIRRKKFVIVIPSFKNEEYCEKNILSVLDQNYDKFRIIFTDDCSPDSTFKKVKDIVKNHKNVDKVKLIKNKERKGALHNLYDMIHSCEDEEIILTVDGDDQLLDNNVLFKLNNNYCNNDIWMLNSQYQNSTDGQHGCSGAYPSHIIANNTFRSDVWRASHLRTFYAWLFKSIKKEDLMINDEFFDMTYDFAIMMPMLEMSKNRSKFLNEILYIYRTDNPISDHVKDRSRQAYLDAYIRNMPKYSSLSAPNVKNKNIGVMLIATNKYTSFLQQMISSADEMLLKDQANITYYVFTDDKKIAFNLKSNRKMEFIYIEHKKFPFASMDRFSHFCKNKNILEKEDYLFYFDVDCKFVNLVSTEIYGDLVGVQHAGYVGLNGPTETNEKSKLFLPPERYKRYFGGGMSGGNSKEYLKLSQWCENKINEDISNGITPIFHDETAINTYFALNEPDVILSPSFHYPQSNMEHYNRIWNNKNYLPKLLLLDKDHEKIREN